MRHIFHPEVGAEFEEAVDYYGEWRKGLGRDSQNEVCPAIGRVVICLKAWAAVENRIRRCVVL